MAVSNAVLRGIDGLRGIGALRPLGRTAWDLVRRADAEDTLRALMRSDSRHPLAPAAVRVERSRVRHGRGSADHTALTMWFGTGPALPAPGITVPHTARVVLRVSAAVLGAAALGALTVIAAERESARIDAQPDIPRLTG